ncbi:uncharacterized protein LOC115887385 [Sitophilus oryzae]|uniref:Uncharacterized protein LOC115887385 n=1 Tax=Sitophilus oryzae TaxID=7048 RepID=A0A6J2YHR5_SITOR|nr:uncharacterized protein LOC115887385 [Sitophilus oryzae]
METSSKIRPSVSGSSNSLDYGSGRVRKRAEGAKNPRSEPGYLNRRKLHIATFNVQTLPRDEKLLELEEELQHIKWDIVGLSEVRRKTENQIELKSGNLLYHQGNNEYALGGVGFLINKRHIKNIVDIGSISPRVISNPSFE